jgi:alpha-mannosidase
MFWTVEKLKLRIPEIIAAAIRATRPADNVLTCIAPGSVDDNAMAAPPSPDAPIWRPLRAGERWGAKPGADPNVMPPMLDWGIPAEGGSNHWLRTSITVLQEWRGKQTLLALSWEGWGQASLEAIAYLDGKALAGFDEFHRSALLPAAAHKGTHEVLLRCYLPFPQNFGGLSLQLRDEAIFQLGHLMRTALGAIETYRDSDPERHAMLARLNEAYKLLDLREGWQSETFAESAHAALTYLRENLTAGLAPGQRPTLISTGHAHMDVAWMWPLWRTRQKIAHTVASALNLMERYPDYYFSMSQPQTFAYLKQDDPELYARLKQRAAEGRFEPVGMMWLEPDCNIPSGESLVRQLTFGGQFFAEEFGVINHVVWLPDVFGYSAALPQLLRGCGVKCFMTTKISWNQFNRMPNDTFRWRGIDGTEVLTHFVTASDQPVRHPADAQFYTYVGKMTAGEAFGTWTHYRQKAINDELLYIYGWGDGGGGPTEEMLETAHVLSDLPGFPQVKQGRAEQYFERLYERVWNDPRLPTWVGELYLEYHRGTYTSQSRTKQANRAAELLYREAEWANAWASVLGASSQQDRLDDGWRLLLLNQFHDILPGSSVSQVYVDSNAQFAEIQRIGQQVRDEALSRIAQQAAAGSVLVFNSLPWERQEPVRLELNAQTEALGAATGSSAQVVEERPGERSLLVEADVPSYGYAPLAPAQNGSHNGSGKLRGSRNALENDELRLELDDKGEIASLYDVRFDREVIAPGATGNQLVSYEDRPMNWNVWDIDIYYEEKPYPVRDIVDWRVAEEGPLRAAVEIVRCVGDSTIKQRICLWRNMRRIDFVTEVDWKERQILLRALFPLNVNAARATCEIQFGAAERPTHRNTSWDWARFEVCAHRWVDLSEGEYGVALLNDGKYGHSLYHNVLGLSLLKGGIHPDPTADLGLHRFTYSLIPHAGDWRAGQVVRRAYELNSPLRAVHSGGQGASVARPQQRYSLLSTPTEHIVVETVKTAQDGDGLIVRLYEAHNERGPASLVFGQPVASAVEVDLLEREIGPVSVVENRVDFNVRPFEVKTFRVRL